MLPNNYREQGGLKCEQAIIELADEGTSLYQLPKSTLVQLFFKFMSVPSTSSYGIPFLATVTWCDCGSPLLG